MSIQSEGQQSRKIQNGFESDEHEARNIFNNIMDFCTRSRTHFVDDSFPPCDKSLFISGKRPSAIRQVGWCTPNEVCVSREDARLSWSVMSGRPSYNDIKQGLLGMFIFIFQVVETRFKGSVRAF